MGHEPFFYARLKPYNEKAGYLIKRTVVYGQLVVGGDGIKEIPRWIKVDLSQAEYLATLHQKEYDEFSPKMFDIVTPEQRALIDDRENAYRRAILGLPANQMHMPGLEGLRANMANSITQQAAAARQFLQQPFSTDDFKRRQAVLTTPDVSDITGDTHVSIPADVATIARMPKQPNVEPAEVDITGATFQDQIANTVPQETAAYQAHQMAMQQRHAELQQQALPPVQRPYAPPSIVNPADVQHPGRLGAIMDFQQPQQNDSDVAEELTATAPPPQLASSLPLLDAVLPPATATPKKSTTGRRRGRLPGRKKDQA